MYSIAKKLSVLVFQVLVMAVYSAPKPMPSYQDQNSAYRQSNSHYRSQYRTQPQQSDPRYPQNDALYTSSVRFQNEASVPQRQHRRQSQKAAPAYMLDLYHKFETDRYSHPMANIVRSLSNIYVDPVDQRLFTNYTRRHVIKFNISSIPRDEDILQAELRLFTLVESDRQAYYGSNRRVSLYELDYSRGRSGYYVYLNSKNIYGPDSGWETFAFTDSLRRWVEDGTTIKTLEVRIESLHNYHVRSFEVDVDTGQEDHGPLLVVFSNDKTKRRAKQHELHEFIVNSPHDSESVMGASDDLYDDFYEDPYDYGYYHTRRSKRDVHLSENQRKRNLTNTASTLLGILKNQNDTGTSTQSHPDERAQIPRSRIKRGTRKRDRHPCRRKPLYVDFHEINWDKWIIAPQGYEAYQCAGRCQFPLSNHLSPTKHAIIQTLLHANNPKKSDTSCCVPIALDPISILYRDEEGVVTYKYKYEDMVVRECGCR